MRNLLIGALALAGATLAAPALADSSVEASAPAALEAPGADQGASPELAAFWRCDAWYVYNPAYNYYWISYNLAYSRSQALGACQVNFGFNCRFQCRVVY